MSDRRRLRALRDEVTSLIAQVMPSTGRVRGVSADLDSDSGSGWVVSARGHFVTNYHVICNMDARIAVDIAGQTQQAVILGTDQTTDLAVLQLEGTAPPPLSFRRDPVHLGEPCFAFGSPLGLFAESVSMGLVSGRNRSLTTETTHLDGLIQTDAAINPGNSGGPLVDVDGLVIGMNTCIRNDAANIGFAVPSPILEWIAAELIEHRSVVRATLGIRLAPARNLDPSYGPRLAVTACPRPCGGILPGDVLLSLEGNPIVDRHSLAQLMRRQAIGRSLPLQVLREGKVKKLKVKPRESGT